MCKALSWLPVGEILAASQWDHNKGLWVWGSEGVQQCSQLLSSQSQLLGQGWVHTADLGPACFSLECPSPPQLWAAPFPGTAQGDTLALQPGGLHALLLNRAPLPHVLGTDGALWVMMEISAPQGAPVLPNYPHPTRAGKGRNSWKEFW